MLAIFFASVLVLGLAACGGQKDSAPGGGDGQQGANQAGQDAAAPEEPETEDTTDGTDGDMSGGSAPEEGAAVEDVDKPEGDAAEDADKPEEDGTDDDGAAAVTASHTDVTMRTPGGSFQLKPRGTESGHTVSYTSADPSIASVAEDGTVTAAAPGTTTISMHVEGGGVQMDFVCIVRCIWEETGAEADQPSGGAEEAGGGKTLEDFFADLQASYDGLGAMMAYEGELLESYYTGLGDISTEQMLVQETRFSMANCAVALVEVSDSADVEAVKAILAARAKTQAEGGAWYPASCETWAQAVIVSAGNFVGMFVCPDDAQAMADAFTAAYGG